MTLEEKILKYLTAKGLFYDDAKQIVNIVKEKKELKDNIKFDTEYQDSIFITVLLYVNETVIDWTMENKPNAFYLPLFK